VITAVPGAFENVFAGLTPDAEAGAAPRVACSRRGCRQWVSAAQNRSCAGRAPVAKNSVTALFPHWFGPNR
jgi:hypothetical protein